MSNLRSEQVENDPDFPEALIADEEIEDELLDEILSVSDEETTLPDPKAATIDWPKLRDEIRVLEWLAGWARRIGTDTKTQTLLKALEIGFEQMQTMGAQRKALIFTESRRTQEYVTKKQ